MVPFGLGKNKPKHYRDMLKIAWENRDNLGYAWRILNHGVCDGCSLGPYGLHDNTIKGVHLCLTRLRMLRMNTMPGLNTELLQDVSKLQAKSGEYLRNLGRLAYPMIRKKGDAGFRRTSWDEALQTIADRLRKVDPQRFAIYTTSRGLTNETYYVAGKFARLLGTNNIDNAARLCHAASTTALKYSLGVAASSCSYTDWIGTELLVLAGANIANNQPVAMKYLYRAKQQGTRIAVVNPYKEPGLVSYWVPSVPKSALFGTRLMDHYFPIAVGGDVAFFNGVAKVLLENDWIDRNFIQGHTSGFEDMSTAIQGQDWDTLERHSGTIKNEMARFAEMYSKAATAVFIWSMGLTQHQFGVDNVKSLINVALLRGMIGRPHVGVVPIRGHSGVQGAAEVGSVPGEYFMGLSVNEQNAQKLNEIWKTDGIPSFRGMSTAEMADAAYRGDIDLFYIIGGNFIDTMPEPLYAREALAKVPLRIHQDLILNSSMFVEPQDTVILLPSRTRYEQKGGGTITSTERRIRYSPEIDGPRIGETKSEWEIISELGQRALPPEKRAAITFADADEIREEMDQIIGPYSGIKNLKKEGDSFQYGGPMLLQDGVCNNLPDGRARFSAVKPQNDVVGPGEFYLTTRRGKQFNSIIYGKKDPMVGSKRRDDIFLNRNDAAEIGLKSGSKIVLQSKTGEFRGVCRIAAIHPRTVQVFWPEANVLIANRIDPASMEPDYNTIVSIKKV